MQINNDLVKTDLLRNIANEKLTNRDFSKLDSEKKLREVTNQFTSIFLKQVFSAMRETLPDDKLLDGGFAEDVFTDMLDSEVSKIGANDQQFSNLNQILFTQLKEHL